MMQHLKDSLAGLLAIAAIVVFVEAVLGVREANGLFLHGIGGRTVLLATNRGFVHLMLTNVPVWGMESTLLDYRHWRTDSMTEYRDGLVSSADWQFGYKVTPALPGRMGQGPAVERSWLGFSVGKRSVVLGLPSTWYLFASAPAWAVVPLLLIVPTRWFTKRVRQHRRCKRGQCLACGYDLRHSTARCPECGRDISALGSLTI